MMISFYFQLLIKFENYLPDKTDIILFRFALHVDELCLILAVIRRTKGEDYNFEISIWNVIF